MEDFFNSLYDFAMKAGIKLVGALLIVIVGFVITNRLTEFLKKHKNFAKIDTNARDFVVGFLSVILKVVLVLTAANLIGVPMSNAVAILGSCGLAVGLALQGSLSNFAGGIMLLIFKPFKTGDFIEYGALSGTVESISILYTRIISPDGRCIVIPNGSLSNTTLINWSSEENKRVAIEIDVAYSTDIDYARKVLTDFAAECDLVLKEPAPYVFVSAHKDSGITLKILAWCRSKNYWPVIFALNNSVKERLVKAGIEIPFPQVDVHLDK